MDLKRHVKTITVRHSTPSRRAVVILVTQVQDALGHWQVPTITFEGPMNPILESGRYARDVGIGLLVASYFFNELMTYVANEDARKIFEDEADIHE